MTPSLHKTIDQLGYAGLVPFVGLAALMWLVHTDLLPFVAVALAGYAAVVASFLGGIHWGAGFLHHAANTPPASLTPAPGVLRFHFFWGVAPSLLAWLALLMPPYAGLPLLGLIMLACYAVDHTIYPALGLAHWLPLRLRLTVVATLSCVLGAAAV